MEAGDSRTAEAIAGRLVDPRNKVTGLVWCGKLKAAYLVAVQGNSVDDVERVQAAAEKQGAQRVVDLCRTYIGQAFASGTYP